MEGPCEKRTEKYFSWYNHRYLVLDQCQLRYFCDEADKKIKSKQKGFYDLRSLCNLEREEPVHDTVVMRVSLVNHSSSTKPRVILFKFKITHYDSWLAVFSCFLQKNLNDHEFFFIPMPINFAEGLWSCLERLEKIGKETPGLFRVAGNSNNCSQLERELLFEGVVRAQWPNYTVHDVAQVFTRLLSNLPEGLFTNDLFQDFKNVTTVEEMIKCIESLPEINRNIVQKLFSFLRILAHNPEVTNMDINCLQIVLGILFQPVPAVDSAISLMSMPIVVDLTHMFTLLIDQHDQCFYSPVLNFTTTPSSHFTELSCLPRFNRYTSNNTNTSDSYRRRSTGIINKNSSNSFSPPDIIIAPLASSATDPYTIKFKKSMSGDKKKVDLRFSKNERSVRRVVSAQPTSPSVQIHRKKAINSEKKNISIKANIFPKKQDRSKESGYHAQWPDELSEDSDLDDAGREIFNRDNNLNTTVSTTPDKKNKFSEHLSKGVENSKPEYDLDFLITQDDDVVLDALMTRLESEDLKSMLIGAIHRIRLDEDRQESFVYNIKDLEKQVQRLGFKNQILMQDINKMEAEKYDSRNLTTATTNNTRHNSTHSLGHIGGDNTSEELYPSSPGYNGNGGFRKSMTFLQNQLKRVSTVFSFTNSPLIDHGGEETPDDEDSIRDIDIHVLHDNVLDMQKDFRDLVHQVRIDMNEFSGFIARDMNMLSSMEHSLTLDDHSYRNNLTHIESTQSPSVFEIEPGTLPEGIANFGSATFGSPQDFRRWKGDDSPDGSEIKENIGTRKRRSAMASDKLGEGEDRSRNEINYEDYSTQKSSNENLTDLIKHFGSQANITVANCYDINAEIERILASVA